MSSRIASHVRDIPRSGIRDFFEIVQSMKGVVSLGIGEPDFVTPWHIREAAVYSLEKGRTGYTSNLGDPRLRRSIAKYVEKNFSIAYNPHDEIIVTVGVSEGIDLALRALLNPGDTFMGLNLAAGGHLTHGSPVNMSGKWFKAVQYGVRRDDACIYFRHCRA